MKQKLFYVFICTIWFFIGHSFTGCKEKKEAPVKKEVPFIPSVKQQIWHKPDGYYLLTFVQTAIDQAPHGYLIFAGDSYVPYEHTISGNFEYIKSHKQEEYSKAFHYLKANVDSVEMLQNISITTQQ